MAHDAVVLEFPSGRRRSIGTSGTLRSVASIAESLSTQLRDTEAGVSSLVPLAIRLDELSGLVDPTITRLGVLARTGLLTPASAARLALRHADEVCGRDAGQAFLRLRRPGQLQIETTLVGDVFGGFALGYRRGDEWVGVASTRSVDRLHELCPPEPGPACLLVCCDAARRTTVRLLSPIDWRRRLAGLNAIGRQGFDGHVVVVGGLAPRGGRRRAILAGIERGLRRGGAFRPVGSDRRRGPTRQPTNCETRAVANLLMLIELAFPGLVDGERNGGESEQ